MFRRRMAVGAVAAVGLAAGGCAVEPATEVDVTSATLNATVDGSFGGSWRGAFEFARADASYDDPDPLHPVPRLLGGEVAAGEIGRRVSATVHMLDPDTSYRYRVCGRPTFPDGRVGGEACLAERTFRTAKLPVGERRVRLLGMGHWEARLWLYGGAPTQPFEIRSDAGGALTQSGSLSINQSGALQFDTTCLAISGDRAAFGTRDKGDGTVRTYIVKDNGGAQHDLITLVNGRAPEDCSTAVGAEEQSLELYWTGGVQVLGG